MSRYETELIECPYCKEKYDKHNYLSVNTMGAKRWTDGRFKDPLYQPNPFITKCNKCKRVFWIEDANTVAYVQRKPYLKPYTYNNNYAEPGPEIRNGKPVYFYGDIETSSLWSLEVDEIRNTIESNETLLPERMVALRKLYWHESNDMRRETQFSINYSDKFLIENLKELIKTLDESIQRERIIKAEIYRELECYDEALKLINIKYNSDADWNLIVTIKDLAEKHSSYVKVVGVEDPFLPTQVKSY